VLAGAFNLTNGTYENLVGGTALRNIEAAVGGDGQGGFTLSLKAQDMNDGTVTLSGRIANDESLTADISADMSRLDVLHRDDVIAAASGKITYTGPFAAGQFKGNVAIVNSLVRLGGSYMPEIPLLRALPGFEPVRNDGMLSAIRLDIAVTTSDPMRIEGEGLDSLWRGELNVAGSVAAPDVRGTLTLDRGSFSFLGQTFTLDSGAVTFTGGGTIDPQLNIVAVREASDITATVNITGRARSPDVQLSSRPALPRDEILARLLFRKGTGELGPIESIQLASAASDLAGISDGGINGVLRRTLGIDVSSGAEGDSLMVGRQIGRNLYISVGQSLIDQEREIVVEWRISRSFSLKSTTSDVTGADIGIFWRKDY
jgi:translocation and assembly module TamB